jgi:hypothetical protein
MRPFRLYAAVVLAIPVALFWQPAAWAVSCTTQSQMTQTDRSHYEQVARSFGVEIQAGNASGVRADTVAAVATKFDGLADSIQRVAPQIQKAQLTVDALYNLNAQDLKAGSDRADFFCALPGSPLIVTVSIPQLPPGNYLLAVLHATGVPQPQQLSLILQNDPAGSQTWKLAGLYIRPLTIAGHDGLWYWAQARALAAKQQNWNSYFYYETAGFLLNPVDFFSSPNLEKLQKEAQLAKPAEVPGKDPLVLKVGSENLEITAMRTESFQGGLDLVVNYKAKDVSDPVATRTQIVELMKALLVKYPELRAGFHGLWVYAYSSSGQSFAVEQPMSQIQ